MLHLMRGYKNDGNAIIDSVVLIDLESNEQLHTLSFEGELMVMDVLNSNTGDFAVSVRPVIHYSLMPHFFDHFGNYVRYLILDEELNVVDEFFITDERLLSNFNTLRHGSHTVFVEGELIIYYMVEDEVYGVMDQTLRRYNLHTRESNVLFAIQDDLGEFVFLNAVRRVDEHTFFVSILQSVVAENKQFGFIDLLSEEFIAYYEPFDSGNMPEFSGNYVLFREAPNFGNMIPGQPFPSFELERNEVLIVNTETRERHFIELLGIENMQAVLSLTGEYVVTMDNTLTLFRKYEIETGNLVFEQEVKLDGENFGRIRVLPTGEYELLSHTLTGIMINEFEEEIRFYREIISINEVEE